MNKLQSSNMIPILVSIIMIVMLLVSFPAHPPIYSLPSGRGHSPGPGGIGGIGPGSGPLSGPQINGGMNALQPGQHPNTGCMAPNALFPQAANCGAPNVLHPTNAPNTAIVQPSNCNVPTSVHTTSQKNVVVHPATTNCANIAHPSNVPNTTVVQTENCNAPTVVHHTTTPSTTVVHPSNCPSTTTTTNTLTVNNAQSSSSSSGEIIPIANAGPNQSVHSSVKVTLDGSKSYDPDGRSLTYSWLQLVGGPVVILSNGNDAKPTFTAPIVTTTTNLTFQLIVNNGKADSSPSLVSITIKS
jgi:hypothetical protein